jgi:bile acid-coenzyme A ligase
VTTMPMGDILRYHAGRKPADALALSYPNARFTWRELDASTNRRARLYRSLGVGKGDRVAIALGNGTTFHEAAFAIWKLGATPAALSPHLSPTEFLGLTELIQPRLLVRAASDAAGGLPVPSIAGDADMSGFSDEPFPSEAATVWKISSSGGSTGRPKIIVHDSPPTFDPDTLRIRDEFRLRPDGIVLNPGPLYHNAPFLFSSYGMFTGCTVIGMDRFDPEEALRLVEAQGVNWVCFVPTMMHRIWSLPRATRERYDLSSLETVWHMASVCPTWLKEAWIGWLGADRIWERYGGTEGFGSTIISGPDWLTHRGSVGHVANNATLKIVRDDGTPCGLGEVGELYFRPAGNRPPSYYIGAEPRRDADGFYSMGDLGHQDAEGFIYLADRRTDLIIRGGANIYPAEIEAVLDAHSGVASSIVIGLPDDELGARIHAIVEPRPGSDLDLGSVHAFLSERVVKYKLPESYEILPYSLRDEAGKARRTALRAERIEWIGQDRAFRILARELVPATAQRGHTASDR